MNVKANNINGHSATWKQRMEKLKINSNCHTENIFLDSVRLRKPATITSTYNKKQTVALALTTRAVERICNQKLTNQEIFHSSCRKIKIIIFMIYIIIENWMQKKWSRKFWMLTIKFTAVAIISWASTDITMKKKKKRTVQYWILHLCKRLEIKCLQCARVNSRPTPRPIFSTLTSFVRHPH